MKYILLTLLLGFFSSAQASPYDLKVNSRVGNCNISCTYQLINVVADDVTAQLIEDLNNSTGRILIIINSPGGYRYVKENIIKGMKNSKAHVVTSVQGMAASAASFIAMAGHEIEIQPGSYFVLHRPYITYAPLSSSMYPRGPVGKDDIDEAQNLAKGFGGLLNRSQIESFFTNHDVYVEGSQIKERMHLRNPKGPLIMEVFKETVKKLEHRNNGWRF